MKNKEFVANITNGFDWINKDDRKSKRWLITEAILLATTFMAQDQGDRKLYRDSTLFTKIDCFPMVPDNIVKCDVVEFKKCAKLMKSKNKLPKMIGGRAGNSLISVFNLDYTEDYQPTTLMDWGNKKKRENFDMLPNKRFAFTIDGYLYIPDSATESVNLVLLTTDPFADESSDCKECDCESVWDKEFICPDRYLMAVQQGVRQNAGLVEQVTPDENPNMDENIKSRANQPV